jgi:hypothetical protein
MGKARKVMVFSKSKQEIARFHVIDQHFPFHQPRYNQNLIERKRRTGAKQSEYTIKNQMINADISEYEGRSKTNRDIFISLLRSFSLLATGQENQKKKQ